MQSFLHTFAQFLRNCAWSLSSALDDFSCKQSLIFACRLNYPAKLHAATACRFCVRPAHRCKNFAGGFVGGVRGFLLPAISASSLAVSSSMVYFVIGDCRRRYCLFGFSTLRYRGFSFNTSSLWLYRSVFDDKHRERRVVRPIIKIEFQDLIFRRIERFKIRQQCVSFLVARVAAVINAHAH